MQQARGIQAVWRGRGRHLPLSGIVHVLQVPLSLHNIILQTTDPELCVTIQPVRFCFTLTFYITGNKHYCMCQYPVNTCLNLCFDICNANAQGTENTTDHCALGRLPQFLKFQECLDYSA